MLFLMWLKWLDIYTNHNDSLQVPNLQGVYVGSLDSLIESYNFRYTILDSVFDQSKRKGAVVNQDPLPGS